MKPEKVKTNWRVDAALLRRFKMQAVASGLKIEEALEAALLMWCCR